VSVLVEVSPMKIDNVSVSVKIRTVTVGQAEDFGKESICDLSEGAFS